MGASAPPVGSPDWCRALAARLEGAVRRRGLEPGGGKGAATVLLGQVVTGAGPRGTAVDWLVRVSPDGEVAVEPGRADEAPVLLVTDAAAVAALSAGAASVSDLLATGRVRVRGDAGALLDVAGLLEALAQALATTGAASAEPSPDRHAAPPDGGPTTR